MLKVTLSIVEKATHIKIKWFCWIETVDTKHTQSHGDELLHINELCIDAELCNYNIVYKSSPQILPGYF